MEAPADSIIYLLEKENIRGFSYPKEDVPSKTLWAFRVSSVVWLAASFGFKIVSVWTTFLPDYWFPWICYWLADWLMIIFTIPSILDNWFYCKVKGSLEFPEEYFAEEFSDEEVEDIPSSKAEAPNLRKTEIILPKNPCNKYKRDLLLSPLCYCGEDIPMALNNFKALIQSSVYGIKEVIVFLDDLRFPKSGKTYANKFFDWRHLLNNSKLNESDVLNDPQSLQSPSGLNVYDEVEALVKKLQYNKITDITDKEQEAHKFVIFENSGNPQKIIVYFARTKFDNVPHRMKAGHINCFLRTETVQTWVREADNSFLGIMDARHRAKPQAKAALLQYWYIPDNKKWKFYSNLAMVQAQHYYEPLDIGHPLQPGGFSFWRTYFSRQFWDVVPNAGTMNMFNLKCLMELNEENPSIPKLADETVTEDKETMQRLAQLGKHSIFHPYIISVGEPAATIVKEFLRQIRWVKGAIACFGYFKDLLLRRKKIRIEAIPEMLGDLYVLNVIPYTTVYILYLCFVAWGIPFVGLSSSSTTLYFAFLMNLRWAMFLFSLSNLQSDDIWAVMTQWLNYIPVYAIAIWNRQGGFSEKGTWVPTGSQSKDLSEGSIACLLILFMQLLNIMAITWAVAEAVAGKFTHMWVFTARIGLGLQLIWQQWRVTRYIIEEFTGLSRNTNLGPVMLIMLTSTAALLFCGSWDFNGGTHDADI